MVNYHQAKLAVNTVFLQGVRTAQDVTPMQLKHIYQASKYYNLNLAYLLHPTCLSRQNAKLISRFWTRPV